MYKEDIIGLSWRYMQGRFLMLVRPNCKTLRLTSYPIDILHMSQGLQIHLVPPFSSTFPGQIHKQTPFWHGKSSSFS